MTEQKNKYNEEPVYYCTRCMSLRIMNVPILKDSEYCDFCGSTNIKTTDIETWQKQYKSYYGHSFLDKY